MKKILTTLLLLVCCLGLSWADGPFRIARYDGFKVLSPKAGSIVMIGNSITDMHIWQEVFRDANGDYLPICGRGNSGSYSTEQSENIESYIANGPSKVFMMIGTNDPIPNPVQLIDWHDDSCFVLLDNEYTCYTIDGKPVFALHDKEQLDNLYAANKCFLSYREFITAYYDPYVHKLTIKRVDVTDSSKLVAEFISLFEDMPQDTKSTISFQKTTGHVLIEVKAISITGRTETATLDYNTETNEVTRTK